MKVENEKLIELGYTSKCEWVANKKTGKTYYMCYKKNGKHQYEHILVYEAENGPIPAGYVVHHVDGNGLNNDLSNLQLKTRKDHKITHAKKIYIDGILYSLEEVTEKFGFSNASNCIRALKGDVTHRKNKFYGHEVQYV